MTQGKSQQGKYAIDVSIVVASRASIAAATPNLRVVALRHQSKRGPDVAVLMGVPQLGQEHTGARARACQRATPFTEHGPSVAGLPLVDNHRVLERKVVEVGSREDILHARFACDDYRAGVGSCPTPLMNEAVLVIFKRASRMLQQVGARQRVWAGCFKAVVLRRDETAEGFAKARQMNGLRDVDRLRRHNFARTTLTRPLSLATVDRTMIESAEAAGAATVASTPSVTVAAAALPIK